MSSTHCLNENCIVYCTRLENKIHKLKTENNILQAKNMILTHNCEEYTSYNERQQMVHQIELCLARAPIKNLQIKIGTLQKVKHTLDNNCDALKQKIEEYEQKHIQLESHLTNKQLSELEQLKDAKELCKKFQIENWLLNEQMHTVMHEISIKDQEIARLDAKLKQTHHRFERKMRRKIAVNDSCMKISESVNTSSLSRNSSTLYYSASESAKAVIYALRNNNKSYAQSRLHSVSNFSKSIKTETKKPYDSMKHRMHETSFSLSITGYDTSDKEDDDNQPYSDEEEIVEANIMIGRFKLEYSDDGVYV